jgi:hypothetical protein
MPYVSSATRPDVRGNGPGMTRVPSPDVHHDDEVTEPMGRSYEEPIDWGRLGMFGLGMALGAILGSGTALLFAPQSGEEVRAGIGRRARSMREDAHDAWDDLRDELEWAGRRGRRRLSRGATRTGWAAEDLLDRGRRRVGL